MKKLITLVLLIVALIAGWDYYRRYELRQKLGPGVQLAHGHVIEAEIERDLVLSQLKSGDEISFRAKTQMPIGTTAVGDSFLMDAHLIARVTRKSQSEALHKNVVMFAFQKVCLPGGCYKLKGMLYDSADPMHDREAPMIGSFVGMEFGPVGIIGGFLLGIVVPYYYGMHFDAPECYVFDDMGAGSKVSIKLHYADYIPFNLRQAQSTQVKGAFKR